MRVQDNPAEAIARCASLPFSSLTEPGDNRPDILDSIGNLVCVCVRSQFDADFFVAASRRWPALEKAFAEIRRAYAVGDLAAIGEAIGSLED